MGGKSRDSTRNLSLGPIIIFLIYTYMATSLIDRNWPHRISKNIKIDKGAPDNDYRPIKLPRITHRRWIPFFVYPDGWKILWCATKPSSLNAHIHTYTRHPRGAFFSSPESYTWYGLLLTPHSTHTLSLSSRSQLQAPHPTPSFFFHLFHVRDPLPRVFHRLPWYHASATIGTYGPPKEQYVSLWSMNLIVFPPSRHDYAQLSPFPVVHCSPVRGKEGDHRPWHCHSSKFKHIVLILVTIKSFIFPSWVQERIHRGVGHHRGQVLEC